MRGCLDVISDTPSVVLGGFYMAPYRVFAEYCVACGGYYDLADIVQWIEQRTLAPDKTTLNVMTIYEDNWQASYEELQRKKNEGDEEWRPSAADRCRIHVRTS